MAVIIWREREESLTREVRSGRRVFLSAEEYREEAEELDARLDGLLDMAHNALTIIADNKKGALAPTSFEQSWTLGRAVAVNGILRHEAMRGEVRTLLWQALAPKCWHGVRADASREPKWRELLPQKATKWQNKPKDAISYRFLEIGYWLREHSYHEAGELFNWKTSNAQDIWDRSSLRAPELRKALLLWLRQQPDSIREEFKRGARGSGGFRILVRALAKRFPSRGPGSARLPQHYEPDELQRIVNDALDAARDTHFPAKSD